MKHIPIPNKNELDDSKLEAIVQKWSENTTTGAPSKESPVSSDEKPATNHINSTDDNNSNTASGSDGDTKQDVDDDGGNSSQEDEDSKTEGNIQFFFILICLFKL